MNFHLNDGYPGAVHRQADTLLRERLQRKPRGRGGDAVDGHAVRRHGLVEVDEAVDGDDEAAADRAAHGDGLEAVEREPGDGPDDRVRAVVRVQAHGYHRARVRAEEHATAVRLQRLEEDEQGRFVIPNRMKRSQ